MTNRSRIPAITHRCSRSPWLALLAGLVSLVFALNVVAPDAAIAVMVRGPMFHHPIEAGDRIHRARGEGRPGGASSRHRGESSLQKLRSDSFSAAAFS